MLVYHKVNSVSKAWCFWSAELHMTSDIIKLQTESEMSPWQMGSPISLKKVFGNPL